MANNTEVVKVLSVDTRGSERTVKSLKQEIEALRNALLNTEQGTQEYANIVEQLATDTKDLSTVMSAHKDGVVALEGSYNQLVNEMKLLKAEWRATNDEGRRSQLGAQINDINDKLKQLDASTGNFQRNVGNYEESFSAALSQMNQSIEPTVAKFDAIQKTAAGLTSGIAALTGTMALLGVEDENVQQSLLKVQSAMAIAQGVGGMKDLVEGVGKGITAFKGMGTAIKATILSLNGLKLAIAATGIGLLVTAIGFLVSSYIKMREEQDKTKKSVEDLEKAYSKLVARTNEDYFKAASLAMKKYNEDVKNAAGDVTKLTEAQNELNAALKEAEKAKLTQAVTDASKNTKDAQTAWVNEKDKDEKEKKFENYSKAIEEERKAQLALAKFEKETNDEIVKLAQDKAKALEDLRKQEQDKAKAAAEKEYQDMLQRVHNEIEFEKERQAAIKETQKAREDALNNNLNRADNLEDNRMANADVDYSQKELAADSELERINLRIEALKEEQMIKDQTYSMQMMYLNDVLKAEETTAEERANIQAKINDLNNSYFLENKFRAIQLAKENKTRTKIEAKEQEDLSKAKIATTKQMFGALAALTEDWGDVSKGFAIGQATIDTYASAVGAYKAYADKSMSLAIAASAAALAAGFANIKSILKTEPNGSNASTATSSPAAVPSMNIQNDLPVQYSRNVMTDAELDEINRGQRVYVLENDITQAQKKVQVRESNSTF